MFYFSKTELNEGGNFIMLCGAPGAGKTTKAYEIVNANESDIAWTIISTDDIRKQLREENGVRPTNKVVFEKVHKEIYEALIDGCNIIYDATNCNRQSRRNIMNTVRKVITGRSLCLILKTNLRTCLANVGIRDAEDPEGWKIPDEVIETMYTRLQSDPPSMREGYDIIAHV